MLQVKFKLTKKDIINNAFNDDTVDIQELLMVEIEGVTTVCGPAIQVAKLIVELSNCYNIETILI